MVFSSYEFLFFLLITVAGFYQLDRFHFRLARTFLLLASFVFYAWWRVEDIPFFIASILVNYLFGQFIRGAPLGSPSRRYALFLGIGLNLAALAWFKYAKFISINLAHVLGPQVPTFETYLPLAISFFTFTQIAYLVDEYRSEVPKYALRDYALFVNFFPHLIAGPIVHHNELLPQLMQKAREHPVAHYLAVGATLFALGLAKKVLLADNMAPFADAFFTKAATGQAVGLMEAWIGVLAYSLQIYFDFSGYSDMACGASYMFGFKLPINFYSPYKATSIVDFWRRWHITLSRFLRDFLYIPLGGNRKGPVRRYVNLLITMLLGGLWHGAGWTFVIWGGLHGMYLVINHAFRGALSFLRVQPRGILWILAAWLTTQLAVIVAWVFFRSDSFATAQKVLHAMAGASGLGSLPRPAGLFPSELSAFLVPAWEPIVVALGLAIALLTPNSVQLMRRYQPFLDPTHISAEQRERRWAPDPSWRPSPAWAAVTAVLLVASLLSLLRVSPFLYFQF